MRILLILPGNSTRNKAWGEAVAEHYGGGFDQVIVHEYRHWQTGESNIDFAFETEAVREMTKSFPADTEVTVFAKSAGSLLTFIATKAGAIAPAHCAFFGIPFDLASVGLFEHDWSPVESFVVPAIAFHNEGDPTANFAYTKETITNRCPHIELVPTVGDDHGYFKFAEYDLVLTEFLV